MPIERPVVPGANWVEVAKRNVARKKKSVSIMNTDSNQNGFNVLREEEVESDADSVLSANTIQRIVETVPRHRVDATLNLIKQAKCLVKPTRNLPPQASGVLCRVYVNKLFRTSYNHLRNMLKAANIFMKNIKDLNWCGKSTLEIIAFKTYESELKNQLELINWKVVENFDLTIPADPKAEEDAKEYTFTQAARHFARTIYKRQHLEHDAAVLDFQQAYVESKGPRFQSAVRGFIIGIAENPRQFFPYLPVENMEISTEPLDNLVPSEEPSESTQLDSMVVEIAQQ
jgi:hypothetical protein